MNKKYLVFVLSVFVLTVVTAGVIQYFGQKQIEMTIEAPVVFNGETIDVESIPLIAGDGYRLYLVEGENRLERVVDVEFQFSLLDSEGNPLADTNGFYLAYSDDLQYAYNPEYGAVSNWEEAQVWMFENLDWFDWVLTDSYDKYDSLVITNHGGNSVQVGLPFNTPIQEDLEFGKFYAVVYLDINEAVIPNDYTLSIDMMPII